VLLGVALAFVRSKLQAALSAIRGVSRGVGGRGPPGAPRDGVGVVRKAGQLGETPHSVPAFLDEGPPRLLHTHPTLHPGMAWVTMAREQLYLGPGGGLAGHCDV